VIGDVAEGLLKVSQHSSNSRSQDRIDDVFSNWGSESDEDESSETQSDRTLDIGFLSMSGR
jgi:hypothetical protein